MTQTHIFTNQTWHSNINIHKNISTDNNVGEFRFHNLHRIAKSFVRGWLYYVYVIHTESECTIAFGVCQNEYLKIILLYQ